MMILLSLDRSLDAMYGVGCARMQECFSRSKTPSVKQKKLPSGCHAEAIGVALCAQKFGVPRGESGQEACTKWRNTCPSSWGRKASEVAGDRSTRAADWLVGAQVGDLDQSAGSPFRSPSVHAAASVCVTAGFGFGLDGVRHARILWF